MSTVADKIAAAKARPAQFTDITVSLDAGLSDERDILLRQRQAIIDAASERLTAVPDTAAVDAQIADVEAREADTLITIRIYKIPGDRWADLAATNPMREGALYDARFGYNIHGLTRAAAVEFAAIVEGENEVTLPKEQWAELWPLLEGFSFTKIADTVYEQNVFGPSERIARAKKFSEAATASNKK